MGEENDIKNTSVDEIAKDIIKYLKTRVSRFFDYDPREPLEDGIIEVHCRSRDKGLKKKIEQAIYRCLEQELREEKATVAYCPEDFPLIYRLLVVASDIKTPEIEKIIVNHKPRLEYQINEFRRSFLYRVNAFRES